MMAAKEKAYKRSFVTALLLVVTGIILYVYFVYIMISKLVYPASFSPFAEHLAKELTESYSIGETVRAQILIPLGPCNLTNPE